MFVDVDGLGFRCCTCVRTFFLEKFWLYYTGGFEAPLSNGRRRSDLLASVGVIYRAWREWGGYSSEGAAQ